MCKSPVRCGESDVNACNALNCGLICHLPLFVLRLKSLSLRH